MVSHHARLAAITMSRLILFLDFDGTLTPIVSSPNRARLSRPGERDATETCRPAVGRSHKRASPERSSTASRVARGVLRGTSAGGVIGEDA
jgi:hypothetical protein